MRSTVIGHEPPKTAVSGDATLKQIDDAYTEDAYNSLSIEGYKVTTALIDRVASGEWDKDATAQNDRNALAAKGYRDAFLSVRQGVEEVLSGKMERNDFLIEGYRDWRTALFHPSAQAGIVKAHEIVGFRHHAVFIRGSRHVPVAHESLLDAMEAFESLVREETNPFAKAVLGHFMLGYIHPFPDGNGRTARFFMNAALSTGGHPWIVVPVERRKEYLQALETASVDGNIEPFAAMLSGLIAEARPEPGEDGDAEEKRTATKRRKQGK